VKKKKMVKEEDKVRVYLYFPLESFLTFFFLFVPPSFPFSVNNDDDNDDAALFFFA
jgi:hypothetical protein